ncbi:unnamed protein product [Sympodiomycopsis kandeliae]
MATVVPTPITAAIVRDEQQLDGALKADAARSSAALSDHDSDNQACHVTLVKDTSVSSEGPLTPGNEDGSTTEQEAASAIPAKKEAKSSRWSFNIFRSSAAAKQEVKTGDIEQSSTKDWEQAVAVTVEADPASDSIEKEDPEHQSAVQTSEPDSVARSEQSPKQATSTLAPQPDAQSEVPHKKVSREMRRVSFSPSITDVNEGASEEVDAVKELRSKDEGKARQRCSSLVPFPPLRRMDDSPVAPEIRPRKSSLDSARRPKLSGRQQKPHEHPAHSKAGVDLRPRKRSFSFSKKGIHVADIKPAMKHSTSVSKSSAIAGRHAKVLERLINVNPSQAGITDGRIGSGGAVVVCRGSNLHCKKQKDGKAHSAGVAMKKKLFSKKADKSNFDAAENVNVDGKHIKQLKKALMDVDLANGIIAELRAMDVEVGWPEMSSQQESAIGSDPTVPPLAEENSSAQQALRRVASRNEGTEKKSAPRKGGPMKAVCLAYPESEIMEKHVTTKESNQSGQDSTGLGLKFPTSLPTGPTVMGVGAIDLITSPKMSVASAGLDAAGVFTALGSASGAAIKASGTDAGISPPIDRMAIFTFWWGFEITLPKPSMSYLSTAHSVSGAFLNFLSTMVITGGVPEMLPFVKYLSMAVDLEYKAIQSADKGNGVVLAATWVMPLALVPRSWDYDLSGGGNQQGGSDDNGGQQPTKPAPSAPPASKVSSPPLPLPVLNLSRKSAAASSAATTNVHASRRSSEERYPEDLTVSVVHSHVSTTGTPSSHSQSGTPRTSVALERLDEVPEGK